jgi:fluoride exporter
VTGTLATLVGLAVAGAVGALARHEVLDRCAPIGSTSRAAGVAAVNLVGSAVAGSSLVAPLSPSLEVILVTGFAGALTTFSTWTVDAVLAARAGRSARSVALVDLAGQSVVGTAIVLSLVRVLG